MDNGGVFIMKNSNIKTNKLLLKYVIKVVLLSIFSILFFTFISSEILYKLDLSLDSANVITIIICALSAMIVSYFSLGEIKNNGLLMGVVSQIPLIFYSLINMIFSDNSFIYFLIKTIIMFLIGAVIGLLRTKKNSKIRVK